MTNSFANNEVLEFYKKLPFNYYGDINLAANSIKQIDQIQGYPILPPILKGGRTLIDVGCGAGWFVNSVNYHYGRYGTKATGLDFNNIALNQAQAVADLLKIETEYLELDLFKYIPEDKYDVATSIGVLHHTDNCFEALKHVFRHLVKPGGYAFVGLYHKYGRKPFLDFFDNLKKQGLNGDELFLKFSGLHDKTKDPLFLRSWFNDQVLHPHESQHTLEELIPLIHKEDMILVSTSINKFAKIDSLEDLFTEEKQYFELGLKKLEENQYFPGFFFIMVQKKES